MAYDARSMYTSSFNTNQPVADERAKTVTTGGVTSTTANNTRQYLNDYNANRESKIRNMYSGALAGQNAGLKTAFDQNMSAAQQAKDQISPQYQSAMNQAAGQYERQRRNNNMQAAANGINTGTGSQMQLSQSVANQQNQGRLATSEQEALNTANQNMLDLKTNYQNQIAQAAANNNYQQAAALLDEYGAQYDRTMNQAKQLAEYGDFSMYADLYGVDAAQQMEKNWSMQNPDLAYNLGKLTGEEYFNMTGKYPRGYTPGVYGAYGAAMNPSYFYV